MGINSLGEVRGLRQLTGDKAAIAILVTDSLAIRRDGGTGNLSTKSDSDEEDGEGVDVSERVHLQGSVWCVYAGLRSNFWKLKSEEQVHGVFILKTNGDSLYKYAVLMRVTSTTFTASN
ncbi:hypothetical protein EIP86_005878 [Pleurotus ostreatoroseus]|nr:hypothetical protein EIP86_005878 [Pleurotus ostreatoroseus]